MDIFHRLFSIIVIHCLSVPLLIHCVYSLVSLYAHLAWHKRTVNIKSCAVMNYLIIHILTCITCHLKNLFNKTFMLSPSACASKWPDQSHWFQWGWISSLQNSASPKTILRSRNTFLHLENVVNYEDDILISFIRAGINKPLQLLLFASGPQGMLCQFLVSTELSSREKWRRTSTVLIQVVPNSLVSKLTSPVVPVMEACSAFSPPSWTTEAVPCSISATETIRWSVIMATEVVPRLSISAMASETVCQSSSLVPSAPSFSSTHKIFLVNS